MASTVARKREPNIDSPKNVALKRMRASINTLEPPMLSC